jgi:signal transduction histidine kinase
MASSEQRPIDWGIALAAFAGSLVLLAVGANVERDSASLDVPTVLLAAAASLPLVARRRAPVAVFVVTGLASVALRLVAEPAGPPIGPTLALYFMVAQADGSRARTREMAALVVGMLVAHVAAGGVAHDHFPWGESLFGILAWGTTWLVGERTRTRGERIERERRLAAAEERTRIARDLHDSAGHAINVILVHAGLGRLSVQSDPEAARRAFETIEDVARETVSEIDQMVRALREDASDGVEPPAGVAALDGLLERHRAAGLDVAATVRGDVRPLPPAVDRAAYRIVQEALTNAARHGAGSAALEVAYGAGALELTVANPVGRDASDSGGHGVTGMRERASLLGGRLEAGLRDGRFRVHAHLPLAGA